MFKETVCPTCETMLAPEQIKRLKASHRKGGMIGMVCGLFGAVLGIYFGLVAQF